MKRTNGKKEGMTEKKKGRCRRWCRRNWIPLLLIALALTGLLIALLLSLEPCVPSSDVNNIELVFALDASGSFASELPAALGTTALFIDAISKEVGDGKLSVGVAQWSDDTRAGGGFYSFVPETADDGVQFPYAPDASRVPSSDIQSVMTKIETSTLVGTAGGTESEMPLFGCMEILKNSQNDKAAQGCVIFTDAAWTTSDLDGTPRFSEFCERYSISPCNAAGAKSAMERDGIFIIVGWLEPGSGVDSNAQCPTSATTLADIKDGIEMSTCHPSSTDSSFHPETPWTCEQATPCTDSSTDPSFQTARCCPYWLELSNYDTLQANVESLAKQIGDLAGSSSVCVGSLDFLWALLLFLPFLLYLIWRPLNLATKAVMAAATPLETTPPPAVPTRSTPAAKKPKKRGRWSIVETRHYLWPGSNGGSKPLAVDYGDSLPLPPSALGMKTSTRKTNYHDFNQFAGLKTKDFYNRGDDDGLVEEGDIDDYIMRCCCFLCCGCRCFSCCGGRTRNREGNDDSDIEMGQVSAQKAKATKKKKKKTGPPKPPSRANMSAKPPNKKKGGAGKKKKKKKKKVQV